MTTWGAVIQHGISLVYSDFRAQLLDSAVFPTITEDEIFYV